VIAISYIFFLINVGCPGQLARITTIPHDPLDILQAQRQVRHRGGDRRAHRGSNPGRGETSHTIDHSCNLIFVRVRGGCFYGINLCVPHKIILFIVLSLFNHVPARDDSFYNVQYKLNVVALLELCEGGLFPGLCHL